MYMKWFNDQSAINWRTDKLFWIGSAVLSIHVYIS